jgi:hypothetical protein
MVKCGVLFEVWTEFLNVIYTSVGFKGLTRNKDGDTYTCGRGYMLPLMYILNSSSSSSDFFGLDILACSDVHLNSCEEISASGTGSSIMFV